MLRVQGSRHRALLLTVLCALVFMLAGASTAMADDVGDGSGAEGEVSQGLESNPEWWVSELIDPPVLPETVGLFMIGRSSGVIILELFAGNTVVVKGYESEPFLKMETDGEVFYNTNSISSFANLPEFMMDAEVPDEVSTAGGSDLEPNWVSTGTNFTIKWVDYRLQWLDPAPPASLGSDGTVSTWDIEVEVNDEEYVFSGRTYLDTEVADQLGYDYSTLFDPWWQNRLIQAGAAVMLLSLFVPTVVWMIRSSKRSKIPRAIPDPADLKL